MAKIDTTEMTLDEAQGAFEESPTNATAGAYLEVLCEYEADGMIGDDTFLNGLAAITSYLTGEV